VRIIAGAWRGRALLAPAGQATRPTSDRAREGLFSMLASRLGSFEGLEIADLFAGTGALGLEALSRGAARCIFVESDPRAIAALRHNIAALGAGTRAELRAQAVEHAAPPARPCDLVFMDPPYGSGLVEPVLDALASPRWLAAGGRVSLETGAGAAAAPASFVVEADRRFGKAHVRLLRRA
jgi:16S rRNA (guanine966-N2)-methyltransferase